MKIKGSLFVEVFISKKGSKCVCLKVNLGYATRALTFDSSLIAEVLGMSVVDLFSLDVGKYDV